MRLRTLAAAVLVLAATPAQGDDLESVTRMDKEISVATWTGDPIWFRENLSDDYTLVTPTGAVKTKEDVIRELSAPGMRMEPFEPFDVQVRLYGDAAIVIGRMRQRFVLGGIRYANDVRYTDVYLKRKGKWQLVSGHASTMAIKR
jgi:hypothetical protein